MELTALDLVLFIGFLVLVVVVSLYASRKEDSQEDYFLAGRKLTWPLIGFSLIASNISTEHFVGMAGQGFGRLGLAVASWEWMAALALVVTALFLLPRFLKAGIYTMPEFLEYRYDRGTRSIMAYYLMFLYVIALLATVLYSAARGLDAVFGIDERLMSSFEGMSPETAQFWAMIIGIWFVGIIASIYTIYGGLKAVVWSDLLQGGALVFGGILTLYFGLRAIGGGEIADGGGVTGGTIAEGWRVFKENNGDKLHTVLPINHPELPWLAVFFGGMWIPNLFYWGMNQFITQRTLGAKSLVEGQRGIFLACFIKLLMPFIIIFPGIIAWQLYGDFLVGRADGDVGKAGEEAYPYLITQIVPTFFRGIMLAALTGAVMSTFNSGINSASTIFTIDIYKTKINPNADAKKQVFVGRIATAVIAIIACLVAPLPGKFQDVFSYIQEIWGFISPPIVAAFLLGILIPRAPAIAGRLTLILGPILYAFFRVPKWVLEGNYGYTMLRPEGAAASVVRKLADGGTEPVTGGMASAYSFFALPFLHHMSIVFVLLAIMIIFLTMTRPRATAVTYPTSDIDVTVPTSSYVLGGLIVAATIMMYVIFW